MNAIIKAIQEARYRIPLEVLDLAFGDLTKGGSLDNAILMSVIKPRVLLDCDIARGVEITIPLAKCTLLETDSRGMVIRIPENVLGGRTLISALSLVSINGIMYTGNNNPILDSVNTMGNNMLGIDVAQTANIHIIGDNVVYIEIPYIDTTSYTMRVVVSNDANLNNINPRSYHVFSRLVELAIKSFIYNRLVIKIGSGYISSGHELGVMKDIIDEYKDFEEMYQEELSVKWAKVAFMNDSESFGRYVNSMFGNNF